MLLISNFIDYVECYYVDIVIIFKNIDGSIIEINWVKVVVNFKWFVNVFVGLGFL